MTPARILIVEDKSVIAENLAAILENAGYSITGKAISGEEALEMVNSELPDVVLMDIHLAGKLDGIQTVEQLQAKYAIPVIYLTDFHDDLTIQRAKHTRPAAYLLKPFKEKDLLNAIEIAFYNASEGKEPVPAKAEKISTTFFPFSDRFFVKEKDILRRVDITDILWMEADGAYCKINTKEKCYTLTYPLRVVYEKLNHPMLLRVSRSHAVNMDKVTAIKGNLLIISDTYEIAISKNHRDEIHQRLLKI